MKATGKNKNLIFQFNDDFVYMAHKGLKYLITNWSTPLFLISIWWQKQDCLLQDGILS